MFVPTKSWYKSKMFWLGVVQIAAGALELVAVEVLSDGGGWTAVVSGILTLVFRYVTKQPITFTGKSAKYVEDGRI